MKKILIAYSVCLFFSGCIFSNDDIRDYKIVGNFYVSSFADKNTLLYKSPDDIKLIGSGTVILNNIDSIGWSKTNILAVFKNEYFLIDTVTQKVISSYKGFDDFMLSSKNLKINDYHLKSFPITSN